MKNFQIGENQLIVFAESLVNNQCRRPGPLIEECATESRGEP